MEEKRNQLNELANEAIAVYSKAVFLHIVFSNMAESMPGEPMEYFFSGAADIIEEMNSVLQKTSQLLDIGLAEEAMIPGGPGQK